jgi:hypothetical protein
MKEGYEMWIVAMLCVIAVAGLLLIMKTRRSHSTYLIQREMLATLPMADAKEQAMSAIANWIKKPNSAGATLMLPQPVGPLTEEFVRQFAEITSPNGAHRLGAMYLAESQYRTELIAIGKTDYMEICVRPGLDSVYVIDGSEPANALDDRYPSVFHLLIDYAKTN